MRHGSLFSGGGGFDLAAEWMGWDNIFHCEWMPFPREILKYYWPNSISYEDIRKTDFSVHRGKIDILTGGFPCQPYSTAGKRKGKEDERHLWPEMLRAIREIAPKWIVGENVRGLVNWSGGMVFDEVQADLESEGYKVIPVLLPACSVNAPHRRDRIWFIAYSCNNGLHGAQNRQSNTKGNNDNEAGKESAIKFKRRCSKTTAENRIAPYTNSFRLNGCERKNEIDTSKGRLNALHDLEQNVKQQFASNTESKSGERLRFEQPKFSQQEKREFGRNGCKLGGEWYATNTNGIGLRRENNRKRESKFFSENGAPRDWQNFPTQSPICIGDDGLSSGLDAEAILEGKQQRNENHAFNRWRQESIKIAGNAVVPQLVYKIFKTIEQYENLTNERSH